MSWPPGCQSFPVSRPSSPATCTRGANDGDTQLSDQVGMSSRPEVAFVTCAKATYQAATPQVMPTWPAMGSRSDG
jgi:hypothetical protein